MFFPATPRLTLDRRRDGWHVWPEHAMLFTRARYALFEGLVALKRAARIRRVWIPAYLCCPVPEAVRAAGLGVVLYDVDERLTPRLETVVPRRGDALLVVHYFGLVAPLAPLQAFCARFAMPLIEDCAHALPDPAGAGAGSAGTLSVFSLRKLGPVPGGGLLVVRDARIRQHVRVPLPRTLPDPRTLARLGIMVAERAAATLGLNPMRVKDRLPVLDTSHGAIGVTPVDRRSEYAKPPRPARLIRAMLERTDWAAVMTSRREAYGRLASRLAPVRGIALPVPEPMPTSVPEAFPVLVAQAGDVVTRLRRHGVEASRWPGAEQFPFDRKRFPGAAAWRYRSLCLPLGTSLAPADVDALADIAMQILRAPQAPARRARAS